MKNTKIKSQLVNNLINKLGLGQAKYNPRIAKALLERNRL